MCLHPTCFISNGARKIGKRLQGLLFIFDEKVGASGRSIKLKFLRTIKNLRPEPEVGWGRLSAFLVFVVFAGQEVQGTEDAQDD